MNHRAMDLRKGRVSLSNYLYVVTCTTLKREKIFNNFEYARILINSIREVDNLGYVQTIGFVVMPDHLHWIFELKYKKTLSEVVKQVKGKSSFLINQIERKQGKLWQTGFYDRCLRRDEDIRSVMRYIVANPLRANIVTSVADYPHWDCIYL